MKSIDIQNTLALGLWKKQEYKKLVYSVKTTSLLNAQRYALWDLIANNIYKTEYQRVNEKD